jgi:hypothetical protein
MQPHNGVAGSSMQLFCHSPRLAEILRRAIFAFLIVWLGAATAFTADEMTSMITHARE